MGLFFNFAERILSFSFRAVILLLLSSQQLLPETTGTVQRIISHLPASQKHWVIELS